MRDAAAATGGARAPSGAGRSVEQTAQFFGKPWPGVATSLCLVAAQTDELGRLVDRFHTFRESGKHLWATLPAIDREYPR